VQGPIDGKLAVALAGHALKAELKSVEWPLYQLKVALWWLIHSLASDPGRSLINGGQPSVGMAGKAPVAVML
jgi:hypothetical protein